MKVFIMRHGEAEHFAASDAERALTAGGRSASINVAKACCEKGFSQFDKVLVSPYLRAQETWQAISSEFSSPHVETCDDITPYGQSDQVFDYVNALIGAENIESILLVSHLPLVSYLTAEFATDIAPPMFPTSGLACIEFNESKQNGKLLWNIHR
ncbi:phosphohistidine phosphatase SixA [Vibrio genomosp. F10]|uniref:Phosphohistidine phosphatase SixA n=2 Tax=Vibrio genomosp. F10 TaxID=723171 RepID=A0A1B9QYD0_9VIBR|nr:phosphohistidine phosphatase SixA [Vibrio genomosp. F10]OCH75594.1 phosphohistidine phosphatase SixA [Vibrio genomosp. F10]OEE31969.1 phosphohistidine phosphatase SixA [Vibrio genomosp. F10 str. ZF-129]OEE97825.1 phosphohistidine phosphatase SixA [Vibrio genomosp. F10 str. 9ZC157]